MNEQIHIDSGALARDIARYLAAVDVYRAEHCEPTWRPESAPWRTVQECVQARPEHAASAH